MTTIHQNSLAKHHAIDDAPHHSDGRSIGSDAHGRPISDDTTRDPFSGSVTISFHAHMRLRAYQEQKVQSHTETQIVPENSLATAANSQSDDNSVQAANISAKHSSEPLTSLNPSDVSDFSKHITYMLSEIEENIVQSSEPGYRYLVNMLNNYKTSVEDPQQLQDIMRKEEFYLSRRKPFMDSADFQSYSQVLSQFANIMERQQYAS